MIVASVPPAVTPGAVTVTYAAALAAAHRLAMLSTAVSAAIVAHGRRVLIDYLIDYLAALARRLC